MDKDREARLQKFIKASDAAKKVLKQGDRCRVTKCPGTKRTMTFDHWAGRWMVSKSGIDDYSPCTIDRVNGKPISFI